MCVKYSSGINTGSADAILNFESLPPEAVGEARKYFKESLEKDLGLKNVLVTFNSVILLDNPEAEEDKGEQTE